MTTTWQEEARGIEPWVGARVAPPGLESFASVGAGADPADHNPNPDERRSVMQTVVENGIVVSWPRYADGSPMVHVGPPDLFDPDTLAAFDRRLALRLGAPEEYVKDGAIVFTSAGQCCLRAGLGRFIDNWEWRADVTVDTDDPLLARVRAWKSVKP